MGFFDKLQRAADARRGDERSLASLADDITAAVRRYKQDACRANYGRIIAAVEALRKAEKRFQNEG